MPPDTPLVASDVCPLAAGFLSSVMPACPTVSAGKLKQQQIQGWCLLKESQQGMARSISQQHRMQLAMSKQLLGHTSRQATQTPGASTNQAQCRCEHHIISSARSQPGQTSPSPAAGPGPGAGVRGGGQCRALSRAATSSLSRVYSRYLHQQLLTSLNVGPSRSK
jgi:hypothetical protein